MAVKSFSDFWSEIGRSFLIAALKAKLYFLITLPVLVILFRWVQCKGWWGYSEPLKSQACVDMAHTFLYWTRILVDFPKVFLPGFVIVLLAILYLEWDKYKKDRPSDFTHGKCEGPPGYTRRLKWVNASLWDIAGQSIPAIDFGNQRKRYEGAFSEDELLSSLRRKFARTENKPVEDSESLIRWRIVQNNGQEVHIDLQRQDAQPTYWVMTTKFHEWAGRNLPPRLVDIHHTEFVAMGSKIKI